jgi:hypothetical protein
MSATVKLTELTSLEVAELMADGGGAGGIVDREFPWPESSP